LRAPAARIVAQDEAPQHQGGGPGRERDEEPRADHRPDHREDQERREPPRSVADRPAPSQLKAVHHEVRDDEQRDGGLDVDREGQERRAQGGKPEADRALDQGGEEHGGDRSED
jgi:hypothetical protein